ncbi:hypothetical protein FRC12_015766 [Ceratobasidium sp. 428]|nr:hypothetical protein FRC12_015766 [Ceratobasidium sp. 428]
MDDQKRLMFAIAQSDDIAVGRIVQTALQNGAGIETMIDRIIQAQQGLFSPHNYSQKAFDLIALVLKIGGPRLAFAVAKAMHLPSISTVRSRLHLPPLRPCIGFPVKDEILANIELFFGPETIQTHASPQTGLSLMTDELAVEFDLDYDPGQDAAVGMAREGARRDMLTNLSSRSDTMDTLLQIKASLGSGDCHYATEATMAGIARFGRTDYNPVLVLASGTCKKEKSPDQARWIKLILDSWKESPHGEAAHGKIWTVCTDGDAVR